MLKITHLMCKMDVSQLETMLSILPDYSRSMNDPKPTDCVILLQPGPDSIIRVGGHDPYCGLFDVEIEFGSFNSKELINQIQFNPPFKIRTNRCSAPACYETWDDFVEFYKRLK